jgi:multidrug efflux pump subunit AcrA (membrane-fusion protein)
VAPKRRKWYSRKGTIIAALAVVVVAAGVGTWLGTRSSSAAPLITTTTTVQTVGTGTITQTVSSSGTVEPAAQANLDFGVSGRVTSVDVTAGQTVTVGQALATIDDTSLSAALTQAQANLALDQAQLATDQDDNASAAQIASDEASVASAQSQVASAQTSLDDATLTSTIAGTVASVNLTVGQQVTGTSSSSSSGSSSATGGSGSSGGGSSFSSGAASTGASSTAASAGSSTASSSSTAQIVVVSTGSYIVNSTVDSTQVGQVKVGDQATITVSGSTSDVFGTVATVGLLASTSSDVSSFPVVIDVTGSPSGLYGGSSATVSIITEELQNVIVVPTTAIQYSGNATTVTLDSDGNKVSRSVGIGAASAGETQVTSGLSVGDKIYVTEVTFHGARSGTGTGLFGRGGFTGGGGGFSGGGGGFSGGGGGFSGGGGFGG